MEAEIAESRQPHAHTHTHRYQQQITAHTSAFEFARVQKAKIEDHAAMVDVHSTQLI